jgi:hypothetical protein
VIACFAVSGCNRLVSFRALLADAPASTARWEGAYLATPDSSDVPLLRQVTPATDGDHTFSIYTSGRGTEILGASSALWRIGRGEARLVDLDDRFAVAQIRCAIATPPGKDPDTEALMKNLLDAARAFGRHVGRATVFAPRRVPHVWRCASETPGRLLGLVTPGANFEAFVTAMAARGFDRAGSVNDPVAAGAFVRFAAEFGIELLAG